ncbi:hypothetical protein RR46_08271 [Papilio xuthus]|uniref:Uncharacterized protein n=1 Tax=Papilio xuthus TaxID=66420 RepID=A0A194PL60_PAPXU|nr:hypothetical protein RR46_08271 [Papilio xuthus]
MIGMCGVVCASTHINQVNDAGVAGGPVQRHRNLECTQSARVGTADQAWPPYTVDLHATAPRRKDQRQCLLRHTRPQHQHEDTPLASARAQDENEARAAPSRGLLKRGLLTKGKATTTTTTPAPQDDVEYEDDAEYAEGDAQEPSTEAPPSSTEGKKLVTGGVRPFRSNTDLLEALKRRRAQVAEAKINGQSSSSVDGVDAASKSSYSKKRFNTATRETNVEDAPPAPPAPPKPSRGRFGRPSSRSFQEAEPEEQNDAAPPARTGRTFSRGRGN